MSDPFLRELKAKLAELDSRLSEWQKIKEERDQVQKLVEWYDHNRAFIPLIPSLRVVPDAADRKRIKNKKFQPRDNSKTTQIAQEARRILDLMSADEILFSQFVEMLPAHLKGGSATWREGIRTAIKRAGARFGIMYDDSRIKRIAKSPQTETA